VEERESEIFVAVFSTAGDSVPKGFPKTALRDEFYEAMRILGVRIRTGLNGEFELSSIPLSRVEVLQETRKDRPAWEDIQHVIALEVGSNTWVKGVILEILEDPRIGFLCESCGSRLKFSEGNWMCDRCGQPRLGIPSISARLRVDDGTGVVDVKLINTRADGSFFDRKDIESQMLKNNLSDAQLSREQGSKMVGKEVELNGTANRQPSGDRLEFVAGRVVFPNAT
jgi:hypothetical protein